MTINEILFQKMKQKGLKQKDLAEYLGINQSVTTNWKQRGNNPPAEYLIRICEFLGCNIYELLGVEEKNEIIQIYNKLSSEDKAIVDIIFDKYKSKEIEKLSDFKIG